MRDHPVLVTLTMLLATASSAQRLVPLEEGGVSGSSVNAMEVFDGKLIIGGSFTSFNGHQRRNLQGWDGQQHDDMGVAFGLGSIVHAMREYQGQLYVAGLEPTYGNIARWNGQAWSGFGGAPGIVRALTVWNNALIVGCSTGHLQRWDGASWSTLGQFNGGVFALEVHAGELYVGGGFTGVTGGAEALNRLARWGGATWEPLANGVDGAVFCLKSDALGLLIGGGFVGTSDGLMQFPRCARWMNDQLLAIPEASGATGPVQGIHRLPSGKLAADDVSINGFVFDADELRCVMQFSGRIYAGGSHLGRRSWNEIGPLAELMDGRDYQHIDLNEVNATVTPTPGMFQRWWQSGSRPGFEAPVGSGKHVVYSASPWLLGYADGEQFESAPAYNINNSMEPERHWAGPRATTMDDVFYRRYHRVWKLDRALVQDHIAHWNMPGYLMPSEVRDWPGNGDQSNGEPHRLAPFADLNGNDLYEPQLGEYPVIKGMQATYTIQHTAMDSYYSSIVQPQFPLDLHIMAYSFEEGGAAMNHSIFVTYTYVNRSTQTFDSVRFGQFADFDVGCGTNDLIGCDTTRSLFYAYNGTDFDESCLGAQGYLDEPPAAGVRFLSQPMRSHSLAFYYPSIGPPNMPDVMNGTFQGVPFQQPGYPTHFQFPGGNWLDEPNPAIQPDRKSVAATGPFTLAPGDTLCIDLAFIYARAASGGAYASVDALKLRSDSVQAFYDALGLGCRNYPLMTSVSEPAARGNLRVYPNPATGRVTVEGAQAHEALLVTDMQGRVVLRAQPVQARLVLDASGWAPGAYVLRSGDAAIRMLKE